MKILRITMVLIGAFVLALVAGALVGSLYQRLRYPGVQDTDGLYDIGLVFIIGFAVVAICEVVAVILFARRRKSHL